MDPNDSMRKRAPLPLQDWLWRLDRIQERLAQLLPERDLHVGLSLEMVQDRITNLSPSENELSTFPFGVVLDVTSVFVYFRPESDSGIPWLDLRKECLNRWRVTDPQDWFADLNYEPLKKLLSNPVLARARTWYYYSNGRPSGNVRPRNTMRQGDFLSHILDIQDALVETCSLAPEAVVEKLGGDRSAFGCQRTPFGVDTIMAACRDSPPALWDWLTVLSYMTSHQMHTLLNWWVEDPSWYARDPLGEPEFSTINNYWIGLTPDFRTATEYGLDVLRHLATREPGGQPNGPGQPGDNRDGQSLREWAGAERITLAIVFADVVGSTALRNEIGDERMSEMLEAHFRHGRRLIGEHGGREVKTTGDGFLAVFRGTETALDFAMALHSDPGAQAIKIRVGIHVGEVTVKDAEQDIDGTPVHFANRVVGAIQGAEIWLSDPAKQNVETYAAERHRHLKWERHDGLEMKGFPRAFTLWSLAASAASSLPVVDQFPGNDTFDRQAQTPNARAQPSERASVPEGDKPTPETDTRLIYQASAAEFYNIPKSMLSKAAKRKPSEPGYLWSDTDGKRRWYRKLVLHYSSSEG